MEDIEPIDLGLGDRPREFETVTHFTFRSKQYHIHIHTLTLWTFRLTHFEPDMTPPFEDIDGYHRASMGAFARFRRSRHDYVGWMPVFSIGHVRSREHNVRVVILGHILILREHQTFHRFHSLSDLVVDSLELHTGAYPPSLGSSNLSWASLSFDLVVDPHELSYWGMSPLAGFACIVILVSSGFESLDHLLIIILSVQFDSGSHLNRSAIFLSVQFESGPHLYRSVIRRVSLSRGRTYIDRPSSYQFSSSPGTTPISIGHSSCQFESGPHLYRSAIFLSFISGTAPISIGHYRVI
uniref:Uncharacterized protein n=1 Tax=Vitis vinifera TaxID=29760 RepID=A5C2U6_VITVI|nr:hypothetical protein VITISV_000428 [Vitis vinifera]